MRKISAATLAVIASFRFFVSSNQTANAEVAQQPVKYQTSKYAKYGTRDGLNRATDAHIQVSKNQLPTDSRTGNEATPVGWHNYSFYVSGNTGSKAWLFNRGHLTGYQLSGDQGQIANIVQMTACLNTGAVSGMNAANTNGMLYYENRLAAWVKNHPTWRLDYQVTPIYSGSELTPHTCVWLTLVTMMPSKRWRLG